MANSLSYAQSDASALHEAVMALRAGELVGLPTETVYGLAGDARNPAAIRRIFALKGRPADHPLIVHLADAEQMREWAMDIPEVAWRLAALHWPGPLTLILRRAPEVSPLLTGGQDTVGLRVPAHPVAQALLRAFGGALAAPSANRFGRISPTAADHVRAEFGAALPIVLEGGSSQIGLESTILDLSSARPRILRPGHVQPAALQGVLGVPLPAGVADVPAPRVSGSLDSHYAPRAPAVLVSRAELQAHSPHPQVRVLALQTLPAGQIGMALPAEAEAYARELYAALRALDAQQPDCILVQAVPDDAPWDAVRDRLRRATHRTD